MKLGKRHYLAIRGTLNWVDSRCSQLTYTARGRHFPPIIINALPKSGSTFIAKSLRRVLEVRSRSIALPGMRSGATLDLTALQDVAQGNCVCQQHFAADPHVLAAFADKSLKVVVNIRDPREALVSWTHFLNEFNSRHSRLHAVQAMETVVDPEYFRRSIPDQLVWQVKNYLPHTIDWISRWVATTDMRQAEGTMLLTEYSELARDASAFLAKILGFYGIEADPEWLKLPATKPGRWKFRAGNTKDWRSEYRPDSLAEATAALPVALRERFNWL